MGLPDNSLLDLIEKVKSWISRGNNYSNSTSRESKMDNMCFHCDKSILDYCLKYHCPSCERVLCGNCDEGLASLDVVKSGLVREAVYNIKSCKRCFELGPVTKRYSGKVYPSEESPRQSPEPPSPSFSGERFDGCSSHVVTKSSNGSPVSVNRSPSRSDKDEGEESTSYFFSTSNEYFRETSDVDSSSVSARHDDLYSFVSVGSSPSDSPSSRINITSNRDGHSVQLDQGETPRSQNDSQEQVILEKSAKGTHDRKNLDHFSIYQIKDEKLPRLLDFETNGPIWLPPPPDDVDDDVENRFFTYDDEDDDEVGNSDTDFSSSGGIDNKEPLRAVVLGHFRALVSQLLQGEGIIGINVKSDEWLDTVTAIAWQAANFIKPDTSRGGSMDPCNYVKVKCVASGNPSDSKLVKGVVCTKNIKHKRMTSKYKNTRLLILGGSLEYQRVPNQLLSFNTLLQQENDHLKTIVSKIEAHRPNVLLVEKSVSSFAQEHLLTKEISLVLNVKKTLLERIARCTGAIITPSTDHISSTRLGHCELFHLEKFSEEHEPVNQLNRKPLKTLMFFEGCHRRLGCTVLLRGSSREELKKLKHVVHYAVFAAYHLSLETSFLADEGASLPKIAAKRESVLTAINREEIDVPNLYIGGSADLTLELRLQESLSELVEFGCDDVSMSDEFRYRKALLKACDENLALNPAVTKLVGQEEESSEVFENLRVHDDDDGEASGEYYTADDGHKSILVSFSSHCMLNGTLCERLRLLRVKFYGPSDKPLGRYLRDDLFDQSSLCRSCKESAEAHVICYTHQHGNLTINVRHLPSVKLPGKQDGKIWMWHRCLRCVHIDGVPPATRRVVMSDAAWGLSFGKFLELSFSNHATGNRVASCCHSLQRDCLRFYGFGNTVASFRYSPINILSVNLPTSVLEFSGLAEQSWITKEASELSSKAESLYAEISGGLQEIEQKSLSSMHEFSDANDLHNHVLELIETLAKEKNFCQDLLHFSEQEIPQRDQRVMDILEINHFRHSLLIGSQIWERRLSLLDSLLQKIPIPKAPNHNSAHIGLKKDSDSYLKDSSFDHEHEDNFPKYPKVGENLEKTVPSNEEPNSLERLPSAASILSDKIDSSWSENLSLGQINKMENPSLRKSMSPTRVYSFDSAISFQERIWKELPHLSTLHSFHASGDYKYMVRDPVHRSHFQLSSRESESLNLSSRSSLSFLSSTSFLPEGARIIAPKNSENDLVVIIYDNELSSVISYALSSKDYEDRMTDKPSGPETSSNPSLINKVNALASDISKWQSFGSLELDYMQYASYGSEDNSSAIGSTFSDSKNSHHFRIAFEDESSNGAEKVKFSVTCYFAKQFDALRKRCCPSETDFIRSLSRCRRWSAQGGKSNVYFAKSLDERFIIKQVTKTELESFDEFAPEYFKYMTNALSSGSPTCLAKVLGIYQVAVKYSKGGKEIKMDLMVMENLFYGRSISKVYDLKGSARSRYNSDTTGVNKVLLDMNLLETLRTNPIFLGSKAKRILERAVWNDTSFLASVDVMDYSLLVGVDEKRKELVVGIIDFMRQYTWDKHLETWVKASGILGGPKNASPTIISPKQYKKRFRKAMTTYFLTVPDLWLSS